MGDYTRALHSRSYYREWGCDMHCLAGAFFPMEVIANANGSCGPSVVPYCPSGTPVACPGETRFGPWTVTLTVVEGTGSPKKQAPHYALSLWIVSFSCVCVFSPA